MKFVIFLWSHRVVNQLSAMYEWSFNPMVALADFDSWVHWPESAKLCWMNWNPKKVQFERHLSSKAKIKVLWIFIEWSGPERGASKMKNKKIQKTLIFSQSCTQFLLYYFSSVSPQWIVPNSPCTKMCWSGQTAILLILFSLLCCYTICHTSNVYNFVINIYYYRLIF